jgi:transcriptional regulator with XRE-family HTH domain
MTTIGEAIRKARKEKGMTQAQLAAAADIYSMYISHYETGKKFPSILNLIAIADALGVSLDYLVGRTDIKEMAGRSGEGDK